MSTKFEDMEARYMFEELGYECDKNEERIRYFNKENHYYIVFFLQYDIYTIGCSNENEDVAIYTDLHKAINKQIEELGENNVKNKR